MGWLMHYAMSAAIAWPWPCTAAHSLSLTTDRVRRAKWRMRVRPLLAGPEVRIRITTALPADIPAAL